MLFPTITFAIFFMIVLPVSWLLMPRRRRWKLFMLAASYFFYGYWDWRFVAQNRSLLSLSGCASFKATWPVKGSARRRKLRTS